LKKLCQWIVTLLWPKKNLKKTQNAADFAAGIQKSQTGLRNLESNPKNRNLNMKTKTLVGKNVASQNNSNRKSENCLIM